MEESQSKNVDMETLAFFYAGFIYLNSKKYLPSNCKSLPLNLKISQFQFELPGVYVRSLLLKAKTCWIIAK